MKVRFTKKELKYLSLPNEFNSPNSVEDWLDWMEKCNNKKSETTIPERRKYDEILGKNDIRQFIKNEDYKRIIQEYGEKSSTKFFDFSSR